MSPNKILIVRLGALGDVIHAIPAQQSLHRSFPQARIHWLTEPPYRALLECVPGIERVWTADTKAWRRRPGRLRELWGLVRALRREEFDWGFDFQGLLKSAVLGRLAGASHLCGFRAERFKERAAGLFYRQRVDGEADLTRHVIDTNLHLATLAVGTKLTGCFRVPFRFPTEAENGVERKLVAAGIHEAPVLLNPGTGWSSKVWPAENFGRLAAEIQQRLGLPAALVYGPTEEPLIRRARQAALPQMIPALETSIAELGVLCRRSALMVAGDTGPLHLATAVGTPTVAVMGPTSAVRNGPANPDDVVVQRRLPCSDCYKRRCDVFICMHMPVYEVLRAVVMRLCQAQDLRLSPAISASTGN